MAPTIRQTCEWLEVSKSGFYEWQNNPGSATAAGLQVVNQATARRRELIADILGKLPARQQQAIADALQAFARAAGEIPDSLWPADPAGPQPVDPAHAKGRS